MSPSESKTLSLAMKFGLIAASEALDDAKWRPRDVESKNATGVAIGMAMIDLDYVAASHGLGRRTSPHFVPRILPNLAAGHVSIEHDLRGPNHAVSTACATGSHAIGDAFNVIRNGSADVMLCGGVDASIQPLVMTGFSRARALSTTFNEEPQSASRPFDSRRDGFVIGEGAGVLVLEELQHALKRGLTSDEMYGEVLGYGLSGDAFHVTAGREDGDGAVRAIRDAVRCAGLDMKEFTRHLWLVNAHATSTPKGDMAEIRALQRVLGDFGRFPHVVSNKGNIGHLLGAAGAVESAFALQSLQCGNVPKCLNLEDIDKEIAKDVKFVLNKVEEGKVEEGRRRLVLKNSFGFGGTNVSLVFSNVVL